MVLHGVGRAAVTEAEHFRARHLETHGHRTAASLPKGVSDLHPMCWHLLHCSGIYMARADIRRASASSLGKASSKRDCRCSYISA